MFHARAERTPLQDAVAAKLGEALAFSGFLVLPSQMEGFVQAGASAEAHEAVNFETSGKPCPTAVTVRTTPGLVTSPDAAPMLCPVWGGAMERHGEATVTLLQMFRALFFVG